MRMLLIASILLMPVTALADTASESFTVPTSSVSTQVLTDMIGIAMITISSGATETPGAGKWDEKDRPIALTQFHPVSTIHVYDGSAILKCPVRTVKNNRVEVVVDAVAGKTIWLSTGSLRLMMLTNLAQQEVMTAFAGTWLKLYTKPSESGEFTHYPSGSYRVLEQVADFIKLGYQSRESNELVSPGWMKLHDAKGKLLVWPIYYDDC